MIFEVAMSENVRVISKKLGELLVEREIITQGQLDEALAKQKETRRLLGELLIDMGYATEEEVMVCLTTQYGLPYLPLESYEIDHEAIKGVPPELARKYKFVPIDKIGNVMTIVASDIVDASTKAEIEKLLNCSVQLFITTPTALNKAMEKYY